MCIHERHLLRKPIQWVASALKSLVLRAYVAGIISLSTTQKIINRLKIGSA